LGKGNARRMQLVEIEGPIMCFATGTVKVGRQKGEWIRAAWGQCQAHCRVD
jgi:hypothetical protein